MKTNQLYPSTHFSNLKEVMQYATNTYPNHTAFIIKHKVAEKVDYENITFQKFGEEVEALGTSLIALGLKNKRIAIISPNRYEWCSSYLAVVNGVGIVVPLDKSLPDTELESLLKRSGADAVIFDQKYSDVMKQMQIKATTSVRHYICMDTVQQIDGFLQYSDLVNKGSKMISQGHRGYRDAKIDNDKMSIILFTSGTTSLSKAVMLSHRNIAENIYALNCAEKIYDTDISLAFLPFHHTFGCTGFLFFMSKGAATAFCDGIRHIPQNLKEYKISVFVCVPLLLETMYKRIYQEIEKQGKARLIKIAKVGTNLLAKIGIDIRRKVFKQIIDQLGGNLRFIVSGAAAIDKQVAKGFNEFGIKTVQGYGLTETSPVLCAENDKCIRYGSVGLPLANVQIQIDHPNEQGIGEIKAKGPNVMLGYYEEPEATKQVLKDGWFYTGDLGYMDKQGFIYITGRKKNVIVLKNGKNIYPEELEVLINNLPYVAESMVFGYPKQEDLMVSAKIVYQKEYVQELLGDLSKDQLTEKIWQDIKQINQKLVGYKHIKKIIVAEEPMIKTTTQKIKRFEEIKKITSMKEETD